MTRIVGLWERRSGRAARLAAAAVVGLALMPIARAVGGRRANTTPTVTSARERNEARKFLRLLPGSEIYFWCPGEGFTLALEGSLALEPIPGRGRPVYRVVEAEFTSPECPACGSLRGEGTYWPSLPDGTQRLVLDLGSGHFDSHLYPWLNPREMDFELHESTGGFCPRIITLHLAPGTRLDSPATP